MNKVIQTLPYLLLVGAIVYIVNSFAQTKTVTDETYQTSAIFEQCMQTYKSSGLSGLKDLSARKYEKFDDEPTIENLRYAALVDMFSRRIDVSVSDTMGFPKDQYFAPKSFAKRVLPRLSSLGNKTRPLIRVWIREAGEEVIRANDTP